MMFGFDTVIVRERALAGICGLFISDNDRSNLKQSMLFNLCNYLFAIVL
jgi:hypothetical protein